MRQCLYFRLVTIFLLAGAGMSWGAEDANVSPNSVAHPNKPELVEAVDANKDASGQPTQVASENQTPGWRGLGITVILAILVFLFGRNIIMRLYSRVKELIQQCRDLRAYKSVLRKELGFIRVLGSPEIDSMSVDLLDAFVSLRISMGWRSDMRYAKDLENMPSHPEGDFSPDQVIKVAFRKAPVLLIIGEPGSGKTTLLSYYALTCLKGHFTKLGFMCSTLPLYFPLRETLFQDSGEPKTLCENLSHWATKYELDISAQTFRHWLNRKSVLVLLDGLDEICDTARRRAVCQWIDNLAKGRLNHARLVVTSRWTGYRKDQGIELEPDGHVRADVRGFSCEQQQDFLRKWFLAISSEPGQSGQCNAIVEYLGRPENRAVQELAAVPMLLQIMAVIWKEREVLPKARVELYQAAMRYLLDYRDRRRKLDPLLDGTSALCVLNPVALWLQDEEHRDEVEREKLHDYASPLLRPLNDQITPKDFCENLVERAGVLAFYGKDSYIFRHKSLREYLAGLELIKQVDKGEKSIEKLARHLGDDWWEETLRFFIAEADKDLFNSFMNALFRGGKRDLSQKQMALLRTMIAEARQRPVDALAKCLHDKRFKAGRRHHVLECLKAIGSQDAWAAIDDFQKAAGRTREARLAKEILVTKAGKDDDHMTTKVVETLFGKIPPSFRNSNEYNAEYILIPGGAYTYSVTKKQETVSDLYVARYPVTNNQYRRFMQYLADQEPDLHKLLPLQDFSSRLLQQMDEPMRKDLGQDVSQWRQTLVSRLDQEKRFKGADQPVVGINWYAAQAYCWWLSMLYSIAAGKSEDGLIYRLPTEVEWEWVASGGKRKYPWGDDEPNESKANYGEKIGATTPVGAYYEGATPEGLMDMAGNVWEWMANTYGHKDYPEAIALRGGAWYVDKGNLLCSARLDVLPGGRNDFYGFRVVCSQS